MEDDFHLLAIRAAKIEHFFNTRESIDKGLISSFVRSEIEGILVTSRSVFDLTQEIFAKFWNERVALLDDASNKQKKQNKLPYSFRKIVFAGNTVRSSEEISSKYALPEPISKVYVKHQEFFERIKSARDSIVHGPLSTAHIFDTERGFSVSPSDKPFNDYSWKDYHYYNENLVSLKPWLAHIILGTIQACTEVMESFQSSIELGPELFPEYQVRLRDPANPAVIRLLCAVSEDVEVSKEAAFWV